MRRFKIVVAQKDDCKDIERLLKALAVCLKVPDQFKISSEELERDGFGPNPLFQCLIAEVPAEDQSQEGHTVVGIAVHYSTYSMFSGPSSSLESLYVMPEFQGKGIGSALLCNVAQVALKKGSLKFTTRYWNRSALQFYCRHGATDMTLTDELHVLHFSGEALDTMANKVPRK